MTLQKRHEFLPESELAMMFILMTNVLNHVRNVGLAHAERPIADLPSKGCPTPRLMHPDRGIGFDHAQGIGHRQGRREGEKAVVMVGASVGLDHLPMQVTYDAADIGKKLG